VKLKFTGLLTSPLSSGDSSVISGGNADLVTKLKLFITEVFSTLVDERLNEIFAVPPNCFPGMEKLVTPFDDRVPEVDSPPEVFTVNSAEVSPSMLDAYIST